jgi:hypothetical protein
MKIYSTGEAATVLSKRLSRVITSGWVLDKVKALRDTPAVGGGHRILITQAELKFLEAYGRDTYARPNMLGPGEWADTKGIELPQPYRERALVKVRSQAPAREEAPAAVTRMLVKIETQLAEQGKEIAALKSAAAKQLAAPAVRRNDPRIDDMHRQVNAFVFNEPISIKETWNRIRRSFEARNGVKVMLHGDQTFPAWLRSSGNLDLFLAELQGFLDAIHDELSLPAGGQRSLGL